MKERQRQAVVRLLRDRINQAFYTPATSAEAFDMISGWRPSDGDRSTVIAASSIVYNATLREIADLLEDNEKLEALAPTPTRTVVRILADDDPQSPRECDNLGTMVCWHRLYQLGDEQPAASPNEQMLSLIEEYDPTFGDRLDARLERQYSMDTEVSRRECREDWELSVQAAFDEHYVSLPLYLLDHSGITMSTGSFGDPWDSGQVGFIYTPIRTVKAEHGWKKMTTGRLQQVEAWLESEVEVYDQYLRGSAYGFEVVVQKVDEDGEWVDKDVRDSCWGFYGTNWEKNGLKDCVGDCVGDDVWNEAADIERAL